MDEFCGYIKRAYKVPADYGRIVKVDGKPGIIVGDNGNYIGVNFDEDRPTSIKPCHPTHLVEYLEMGKPRKLTKSQQRYQNYLGSDCDLSFWEWIKYGYYKHYEQ